MRCATSAKIGSSCAHLAAAAARQHRQQRRVVGDAVAAAEARAVAAIGAALDHRVADIAAGEPDGGEIRRLEGQERHQMVVPARHALARPPRHAHTIGAT